MSRRKVTMGFACSMHLVLASRAFSLPIGFGYNQGNLQFSEIVTNDFLIYYDQRTPMDGIVAANALKAAKPHLDRWFQIKRKSPLIVNMSAESENASFANFVTDSIELQTLGQGSRDLAWHEYTHAMMYQHLDNIFGPAGALIHLPWMEAWFLEGLAEAVSVSVGSEQQAGIERYQALQNDWPSWDRIHSLYTSGPFSYRGYATSGAFVAWILRTYDAGKLAESLQTFRSDTMPWWWPWALTPFNDFWPMDTMLTKWTGLGGRELYENYKMAATQHWRGLKLPPVMTKMTEPHLKIPSPQNLTSLRGQLHSLKLEDGNYYLKNVMLKEPSVTATTLGDVTQLIASESDLASSAIAVDIDTVLYASNHWPRSRQRRASLMLRVKERTRTLKRRATGIQKTWLSKTNAWWIESELETTRVCKVPRNNFKKSSVTCGLAAKTPSTLNFLGSKDESGSTRASEIWVALTTQTVGGDRHQVIHLDAESGTQKVFPIEFGGRPHSLAFTPEGLWILVSDRSMRHLRRFDQSGKCLESLTPSDFPSRILNSELSRPWIVNWMGGDFSVSSPNRNTLASRACFGVDDHISPLLAALRSKDNLSFQEATRRASIWTITPVTNTALEITGLGRKSIDKADEARSLSVDTTYASPLDLASSADGISPSPQTKGSDYHWRGRPIFAFPWVGADDALGPQIGMVSVPLMDHMQNETVRATALLGLYSRFPYQELSLTENRWTPTWTLAAYRAQTYNGRYREPGNQDILSSFLDEKGVRLDGSHAQDWGRFDLIWGGGIRSAHLAPYIGKVRHYGSLNEVYGSLSIGWQFAPGWNYLLSSQNKAAVKPINENFNYTITGVSTDLVKSVHKGRLSLGAEAEKTRGPYRRDLQEMYSPLKTFVPGSGGGYNKNSYALTADQGLFSPLFGDTQARAKLNFTHPLIESLDKFTGLIYIDRLDFSAFLNHGTAWIGDRMPANSEFSTAQGYNIDLLLENKGVRFNLGSGVGQVLGSSWQLYGTAGFDALF